MYKGKRVCAVVPAFNEESRILKVIYTMPEHVDDIIIVDDASTDNTYNNAIGSKDRRVAVIRHEKNLGVGAAIVTGHKKVLEIGGDIAVVMAGDAQMDPNYLPSLLNPIIEGGYGYTKGNRFLKKRDYSKIMPRHRIFGNMVLTLLNKIATGYWNIFDPQNGYTAIKRECLETIDLDDLSKGYGFENDMLFHLNLENYRVRDVSMPSVYHHEASQIKILRFIPEISALLAKIFCRRIYQKYVLKNFHPIALFYVLGTIFFLFGAFFGAYVAYTSIGIETASTGTVMMSVLPFLVGFQLLLAALVLDIIETPK